MPNPDLSNAAWRKAHRSSTGDNACIEVARLPGVVAVRDSKDPNGPKLKFSSAAWRAFTGGLASS